MKKQNKRTIFAVVLALVVFIVAAPFIFTKAYANNGSTIAGISVNDLKEDEIRESLNNAIANWSANVLVIEGGGASIQIDPTTLSFNVDATINTYKSLTEKSWYTFWEQKNPIQIPLEVAETEGLRAEIERVGLWDVDETFDLVMQQIVNLQSEPVEAVVVDTSILETERLAFIIEDIPTTAKSVYDMARLLDGTVIGAGESFSLLDALGTLASNANVEGLSFIASLIYHNALNTNTEITERHSQNAMPAYLEPGIEAYVSNTTSKNLSFINKTDLPMKMKLTVEVQKLKVEFFSSAKVNNVTVQVTQSGEINPRTIVRYSDDLAIGSQRLLQEGEKGALVTIFRIVDSFEEQISRDYYPPVNRVVVKSSRQPVVAPTDTNKNGTTQDGSNAGNTDLNGSNGDSEDSLDMDNNGLPDINQGDGYEPEVDSDGNVVLPDGKTTDKAGNVIGE